MLARLLQDRAYCASAMSHNALASEMLENVSPEDAHIVVVSALHRLPSRTHDICASGCTSVSRRSRWW